MTSQHTQQDDSLEDFTRRQIILDGITKTVYVAGTGPGVIVMAEMPGISPHVARFARWVRDAGLTVYMPSLFGRDGAVPEAEAGAEVFRHACVSAEFRAFAANQSSPVTCHTSLLTINANGTTNIRLHVTVPVTIVMGDMPVSRSRFTSRK